MVHLRAVWTAAMIVCLGACACLAGSAGAVEPQAYRTGDLAGGGFHDILPPGENGLTSALGLVPYEVSGTRAPHSFDQYAPYRDLLYGSPGLSQDGLPHYYKDSSFGLPPGHLGSIERPRFDVVIARDSDYGVPHVYGATRSGTMFGLGYVAAEDKLFFMDVLRHAGRAQLSSFAGGSPGNRAMDQSQLLIAPYTEADLQRQLDRLPQLYGADGQQVLDDVTNYVGGVNQYIAEAQLNPNKMPVEYAALGRVLGPDPWKVTDLISTASLVGGIFGKGGGTQLSWARILETFRARFGSTGGTTLWNDWRSRNDPEAPTTVMTGQRFPYELAPRHPASDGAVLPDPASVRYASIVSNASGSGTSDQSPKPAGADARPAAPSQTPPKPGGVTPGAAALAATRGTRAPTTGGLITAPTSDSNALLVAGRHTASGRPIAVMGPQVSYFNPEILMEEDVHGPGIDARGAAFIGVNLYVELGHGGDYAWSATSAGQDIVHTFAVDLCNPDGSAPSTESTNYIFRGQCVPMSPVSVTNAWTPNLADSTAPGAETLSVERTALGPVVARATQGGRPIAYTQLRSTYGHEIDSALGFSDFNNPQRIHNARDFQRAAYKVGYTFNWLYADNRDIAYFNSGNNPVHDPRVDPILPVAAKYEWQSYNPDLQTARYTPMAQHPQAINQDFLTSWNNKQALDYSAADSFYGPVYRSQLLDERIRAGLTHGRKLTLPNLVSAMEDAGTVDLRANKNLPLILDVIGTPADTQLADAVAQLRAWVADGGHRIDRNHSGTYAHSQAIAIMDAWFPLLVAGEFEPALGADLYKQLTDQLSIDNAPNNNGSHLGSAYDNGWYGYVSKDLRTLLGTRVRGGYHRVYCGGGDRSACRAMLDATLRQAIAKAGDRRTLYADGACADAGRAGDQECFDAIQFRAVGATKVPLMPWVNRPTYQQAVDVAAHRPRDPADVYPQPYSQACLSRRHLTFHLARLRPASVSIFIGRSHLRTVRGPRARRITLSFAGRPQGTLRVTLSVRTVSGRHVELRRRYRTCRRR